MTTDRTYRIAEFAALAGVTVRALHHYDRLGLLRPARTESGYRVYTGRDLETLEEIVALKFIGVPLKQIAARRRQSSASFQDVLHAQRHTLEHQQQRLSRAIAAICSAEESLRAGTPIDTALFKRIMEIMHMDTNQDTLMARYSALLKAKMAHLQAMTPEERTAMRQEWAALVEDIRGALDEDPAGARAQALLDRWMSLLQVLSGRQEGAEPLDVQAATFRATPEMRDELWARRADWLPNAASSTPVDMAGAKARLQESMQTLADPRVWDFMKRAREARGQAPIA